MADSSWVAACSQRLPRHIIFGNGSCFGMCVISWHIFKHLWFVQGPSPPWLLLTLDGRGWRQHLNWYELMCGVCYWNQHIFLCGNCWFRHWLRDTLSGFRLGHPWNWCHTWKCLHWYQPWNCCWGYGHTLFQDMLLHAFYAYGGIDHLLKVFCLCIDKCWVHLLESVDTTWYYLHDFVCVGDGWVGDGFVLKLDCVTEPVF